MHLRKSNELKRHKPRGNEIEPKATTVIKARDNKT